MSNIVAGVDISDPMAVAIYGINLRHAHQYDDAEAVFSLLMERFPDVVFGFQELGVLRRMQERDTEALGLFRQAHAIDPEDFLTRKHLCYQLARMGLGAEAQGVLRAHRGDLSGPEMEAADFAQYLDYVIAHPEGELSASLNAMMAGPRFRAHGQVADRIDKALEDDRPLSLIRLGDGEGAWLTIDPEDEARFALLYERNRREMLNVWFGNDQLYGSPGFMHLARRFRQVLLHTDLIGVPHPLRLHFEYKLATLRGVPCIANIFRALAPLTQLDARARWDGAFCENDVHLDLHRTGFLRRLLSSGQTFGIISCHPELGIRLAMAFGARVVRQIIVPEEKGFEEVAGVSGMAAAHYPLVFYRTLARLAAEADQARIWLVAAGFLGKFYCDAVRAKGGIGLDIGSVADGWSGKVTRPTLEDIDTFRLEALGG